MKSYVDYMKELTPDDIYKSLVGYGLFADKLPPCFTSEKLYSAIANCPQDKKPHDHIIYDNIRNINIPRQLGIPNPIAYMQLCRCISDNWDQITKHFEDCTEYQNYKISRIHVRKLYDKDSIFEMNYNDWRNDPTPETEMMMGMKYIVNADISNCFPSIYTHSLSWALVGKETAKHNQHNDTWYKRLDEYSRNTNFGETYGLLIGPHAYNILSEIVLCDIDRELVKRHWKYVRNIDDFTAYTSSEEEAEQFLMDLQNELKKYNLLLNHKKTRIRKLPYENEEGWLRNINSINIVSSYGKVDYKLCKSYFNYAIDLFRSENEDASVIKYAIKVLHGKELTENAKKYEKEFTFHLAMIYPYVVPLLDKYVFKSCEVSKSEIQKLTNLVYEGYMNKQIYESVSFALFWAIKYKFEIETFDVNRIIETNDCVLMCLASKYCECFAKQEWFEKLKEYALMLSRHEDEFDRNWLFVYETLQRKEIPSTYNEWRQLKKKNVTFINFKRERV